MTGILVRKTFPAGVYNCEAINKDKRRREIFRLVLQKNTELTADSIAGYVLINLKQVR